MKNKAAVLGSSGLLGRPLCAFLENKGWQVVGIGRGAENDVRADMTLRDEVFHLLNVIAPDVIINLVALTDVDRCEEDVNAAFVLNVKPVEHIVRWMESRTDVRLIHISSDQVYDGPGPHKEENPTIRNVYALSKYCSEGAALRAGGCALRTNFFGKSRTPGRTSFSDWIIDALRTKKPIKMFDDVFFSPLSIDTLSSMIGLVLKNFRGGLYNLGSREGVSKYEFGMIAAECLGIAPDNIAKASVADVKLKARRPADMRMDCELFEKTFNCDTPLLRDEIKSALEEK